MPRSLGPKQILFSQFGPWRQPQKGPLKTANYGRDKSIVAENNTHVNDEISWNEGRLIGALMVLINLFGKNTEW